MNKRRTSASSNEVTASRLRGRVSSAQVEQLIASLATLHEEFSAMRKEFAAYRARTDAAIDALQLRNIVPLTAVENVEERRPPGNWQCVQQIMHLAGCSNSTVHKWIKKKKVRVYQPGGPRTAIQIDVDSLRPRVSRSTKMPDGHTS